MRKVSRARGVWRVATHAASEPGKAARVSSPAPIWLDDATSARRRVPELSQGTVVVTGNFDGVHRGHQALFVRALHEARDKDLIPVALTFDPHPRIVLGKGEPAMLTSTERRIELIRELGVAHVFVRRFDLAFAAWPAERFVEELLVGDLSARVVVAGDNFHFGARRAGDDALLQRMGPLLGFAAFTLEATDEKGPLSSSRVRDAIALGDLAEAAHVLGRPHSIAGTVVHGDHRGRTIGFPTANLDEVFEMVPPNGVYAVMVDGIGPGVMNIGVRPTVHTEARRTLEVHVFDFTGDLYGKTLRVQLIDKLRDERKFDGLPALQAQIAADVTRARAATRGLAR